jgi:hypothetical protein
MVITSHDIDLGFPSRECTAGGVWDGRAAVSEAIGADRRAHRNQATHSRAPWTPARECESRTAPPREAPRSSSFARDSSLAMAIGGSTGRVRRNCGHGARPAKRRAKKRAHEFNRSVGFGKEFGGSAWPLSPLRENAGRALTIGSGPHSNRAKVEQSCDQTYGCLVVCFIERPLTALVLQAKMAVDRLGAFMAGSHVVSVAASEGNGEFARPSYQSRSIA